MIVYSVWTRADYDAELLEIFTNSQAANEYAEKYHGKVIELEVYDSVKECECAGF
jgi:hypothetical protein